MFFLQKTYYITLFKCQISDPKIILYKFTDSFYHTYTNHKCRGTNRDTNRQTHIKFETQR